MKRFSILICALIGLLSVACASPSTATTKPLSTPSAQASSTLVPTAPPPVDLTDHLGDSAATAVTVPADAPNEGVDFENGWIYDRFKRFRRLKYGLAHDAQRRYDVITVELPDHSQHTIYFDITDLWARWKPGVQH